MRIPSRKEAIANIVLLCVSVSVFFGLAELAARAFYPDFAGQIHNQELTAGKRIHNGEVFGLETRLPAEGASVEPSPGSPVLLVLGDSVTKGYGLSYHDTYWAIWQRYISLQGRPDSVISLSGYGNNFMDNIDLVIQGIDRFKDRNADITAVVYQFNFNDLLPSTRLDLQEINQNQPIFESLRQGATIQHLRHTILNHSVFLRLTSIKISSLFHRDNASCSTLGVKAMGGYSYSFKAQGFEEQGERSWQSFEQNLEVLIRSLGDIPFTMLISPISPMVHPNLPEHHVALPVRMDCATINPIERLYDLSRRLGFSICNPTPYLAAAFLRYRAEGNMKTLFHENDDNHPNESGSLLIGEYCYEQLRQKDNIWDEQHALRKRARRLGYADMKHSD